MLIIIFNTSLNIRFLVARKTMYRIIIWIFYQNNHLQISAQHVVNNSIVLTHIFRL